MQKKVFLLVVLSSLGLLPLASFADIIRPNHRPIDGCAKIIENTDLKWLVIRGKIGDLLNKSITDNQLPYNTCLTKWYKFNTLEMSVKDAQGNEYELKSPEIYGGYIEETSPLKWREKHYQVVKTSTGYALDLIYHEEKLISWETRVVVDKKTQKPEVKTIFSDVTTEHIYAKAIELLKNKNIIWWYPDGTFRPANPLSRAELVKIIVWALGIDKSSCTIVNRSTPEQLKVNGFKDVKASDWFADDLCVAKSLGIIKGYPDRTFQPNRSVSIAEAAKIVVVGLSKLKLAEGNPWYQPYIDYLIQKKALPPTIWDFYTALINRWETARLISSFFN